jgi:hypothetical protein
MKSMMNLGKEIMQMGILNKLAGNLQLFIYDNIKSKAMRTIIRTLAVFIALNMITAIFPKQASAQRGYVSFQIFYDELGPYGRWVAYPHYGYVWVPNAGPDFEPYSTDGHWVLTDYGWTWESDYNWGWAPFHYGRWDYDNYYGWFWVPDNEWGPAWVVWRSGSGYYGWAPMKPGITINVVFGRGYHIPHEHWMFVRDRDFERHDLNHYYIERTRNGSIISNSTIINNTYVEKGKRSNYFSGPDRGEVQKITGKPVRRVAVQVVDKSERRTVTHEKIQIYKPQIQNKDEQGQKNSPKPVERWQKQNKSTQSGQSNIRKNENQVKNKNITPPSHQQNMGNKDNMKDQRSKSMNQPNNDKNKGQNNQSGNNHNRR